MNNLFQSNTPSLAEEMENFPENRNDNTIYQFHFYLLTLFELYRKMEVFRSESLVRAAGTVIPNPVSASLFRRDPESLFSNLGFRLLREL